MPSDTPETSAPAALTPTRQLSELPRDELSAIAEEFGLEPARYRETATLLAAIHARRQLIASLDRESMLDVIRWGRRPVPANATQEQLAVEIVRLKSTRFEELSERGLRVLARLRGFNPPPGASVRNIIRELRKNEGFLARLGRQRRAWMGALAAKLLGEPETTQDYRFLPEGHPAAPAPPGGAAPPAATPTSSAGSIREEIEDSGFLGGITSRLKRSADVYVNQKLDEIEARIDRKLDEIDRRLAEWRDKEIANRIRILKITLWVSVIVAAVSLVYMYIRVVLVRA